MVVAEDHRGRAPSDERAKDVARVDLDAGERSTRQAMLALHPVADVEAQRPELLDRQRRQPAAEIRPDLGRAGHPSAARGPSHHRPPSQFERRQHLRRTHRTDPGEGRQLLRGRAQQATHAIETAQNRGRDVERAGAACPSAQYDRQKLAVGELIGAPSGEPLTWSCVGLEAFHRRHRPLQGQRPCHGAETTLCAVKLCQTNDLELQETRVRFSSDARGLRH